MVSIREELTPFRELCEIWVVSLWSTSQVTILIIRAVMVLGKGWLRIMDFTYLLMLLEETGLFYIRELKRSEAMITTGSPALRSLLAMEVIMSGMALRTQETVKYCH